jgi:hypothetical protein
VLNIIQSIITEPEEYFFENLGLLLQNERRRKLNLNKACRTLSDGLRAQVLKKTFHQMENKKGKVIPVTVSGGP